MPYPLNAAPATKTTGRAVYDYFVSPKKVSGVRTWQALTLPTRRTVMGVTDRWTPKMRGGTGTAPAPLTTGQLWPRSK